MALSYLVATVTQGSADAYAQAEIATALTGLRGQAFQIREIVFELPGTGNASGGQVECAISRRSKAAMPNVTDRDVISKVKRINYVTTSGAQNQPQVERLTFTEEDELLVVEDPLYLQIDSASTSAANVAYVRIGYTVEKISDVDRLTLLTQSLESA